MIIRNIAFHQVFFFTSTIFCTWYGCTEGHVDFQFKSGLNKPLLGVLTYKAFS